MELSLTLFYTMLLRKKQDRIVEAVVCSEEALQTQRDIFPNVRDNPDSFHLFATLVGYMPRSGTTSTRCGTPMRCTG